MRLRVEFRSVCVSVCSSVDEMQGNQIKSQIPQFTSSQVALIRKTWASASGAGAVVGRKRRDPGMDIIQSLFFLCPETRAVFGFHSDTTRLRVTITFRQLNPRVSSTLHFFDPK